MADFIGSPKINLMDGWVHSQDVVDLGKFNVHTKTFRKTGEVVLAVHPEDIIIHQEPVEDGVEFIAYSVQPAGADSTIIAHKGDTELIVKEMGVSKIAMDQKIWLTFDLDAVNLYDKRTGDLITG